MTIEKRLQNRSHRHGDHLIWHGAVSTKGYGVTTANGKPMQSVHRLAYQLWVGPIPDGHDVAHRCDRKDCIEPAHLIALPHRMHSATHGRGHRNGRTSHVTPELVEAARRLL